MQFFEWNELFSWNCNLCITHSWKYDRNTTFFREGVDQKVSHVTRKKMKQCSIWIRANLAIYSFEFFFFLWKKNIFIRVHAQILPPFLCKAIYRACVEIIIFERNIQLCLRVSQNLTLKGGYFKIVLFFYRSRWT